MCIRGEDGDGVGDVDGAEDAPLCNLLSLVLLTYWL